MANTVKYTDFGILEGEAGRTVYVGVMRFVDMRGPWTATPAQKIPHIRHRRNTGWSLRAGVVNGAGMREDEKEGIRD